jgi:hypothetical protein
MGDAQFNQRILLPGDPTVNLHAATKQYVDARPGANVTVSNTAPSNPGNGDLWVDTSTPTWNAPTLTGGWSNHSQGFNPAGYIKDPYGIVRLRGLVEDGAVYTSNIMTLPAGFRPPYTCIFTVHAGQNGEARLDVNPSGLVYIVAYTGGGNNGFVSLDGITFATF